MVPKVNLKQVHTNNKHNKCVIRIRILPHLSRRNKTIKSSILMAFFAPFFFLLFLVFNFADFFGCLFLTTVLSPKEKLTGMNWSASGYELVWSEISPVSADLSVNWQSVGLRLRSVKPNPPPLGLRTRWASICWRTAPPAGHLLTGTVTAGEERG